MSENNPAKVLFVDDEPNVLDTFRREFMFDMEQLFEVHTAESAEEGMQKLHRHGPFSAVVSDMRMPVTDGAAFLAQVKEVDAETVRILLTGQSELDVAIKAINQGEIYRFLVKPCSYETIKSILLEALERNQMLTLEKRLMQKVLHGSMMSMTDILTLLYPETSEKRNRIRAYVKHLASKLGLPGVWQHEFAASMSQLGHITLPKEVQAKVNKGMYLNKDESKMVRSHAQAGLALAAKVCHTPHMSDSSGSAGEQERIHNASIDEIKKLPKPAINEQMLLVAQKIDEQICSGESLRGAIETVKRTCAEINPGVAGLMSDYVERKAGSIPGNSLP